MSEYRPALAFNVPMFLLIPTGTKIVKGVTVKEYPEPANGELIYCSFRSFGGTESTKNGVYSVIDTANIETWYRPDIKADCKICFAENTSKIYEIIGTPENIEMRNQFLKFKVKAVSGGA